VTAYVPNPVVTFNNTTTYADNTIADISINIGRGDVIEATQAGYARIVLWTPADTPLTISLADTVTVAIDKGTTGTATIFTGIVSDIDLSLAQYGDIGSIAEYSLTCVGPLAQLNKRLAGASGYPKEKDGDRVYAILSEAFLTQWSDVAPTTTWSGIPVATQWDDYDGVNETIVANLATTIDRPGQYELEAYTDGADNALTLASDAAQSGRGVIYEAGNGHLHYGDYASRVSAPVVNLTADDLLIDGLQSAAQWSEIVNDVTVTYKANAEKFARNEASVTLYGQLSGTRSTSLKRRRRTNTS
jgi:hypothetical protein